MSDYQNNPWGMPPSTAPLPDEPPVEPPVEPPTAPPRPPAEPTPATPPPAAPESNAYEAPTAEHVSQPGPGAYPDPGTYAAQPSEPATPATGWGAPSGGYGYGDSSQGQYSQAAYDQTAYNQTAYSQYEPWAAPGASGAQDTPAATKAKRSPGRPTWVIAAAIAAVAALLGGVVGGLVVDDNKTTSTKNASSSSSTNSGSTGNSNTKGDTSSAAQASQAATPSSIRSVLDKVQPAVVTIQVDETGGGTGSGTGMIITSDGEVLTNAHVVSGGKNIRVTLNGKKDSIPATALGIDPSIDSAVLQLQDQSNLPVVQFGDSNSIQVGDQVVAIGNALALAGGPSVTTGIVSAKERSIPEESGAVLDGLIQTDAAINPGNSGGPLANMNGEVIGMNTAVIRGDQGQFQNIGFALSINSVHSAIPDLKAGKVSTPAYLGVNSVTLDDSIRTRYGLTPKTGVVIDTVSRGSPADTAGLAQFDVITQVDGKDVTTSDELVSAVRAKHPGDKVSITYYRGSDKRQTTATLVARPSSG